MKLKRVGRIGYVNVVAEQLNPFSHLTSIVALQTHVVVFQTNGLLLMASLELFFIQNGEV